MFDQFRVYSLFVGEKKTSQPSHIKCVEHLAHYNRISLGIEVAFFQKKEMIFLCWIE